MVAFNLTSRSFRLFLAFGLFTFLALTSAANAQNFPALSGRVVDEANLLDPSQEAALTAKLETLDTQSGRQLVVATIPDLEGYPIEDYGYQLGREWGIGDEERNDGLLLIVAPNDRKVRVEVGYGLEGIMTDALSSLIIQQDILPRFRDGDMPAGINAGVDRIIDQLQLPEDEARAQAASAQSFANQSQSSDGEGALIGFWIVVFFIIIIISITSASGGRRHRRGSGPVVIWGGGSGYSGGSSWGGGSSGGFGGGGFSGGGGSFGGGGASGGW